MKRAPRSIQHHDLYTKYHHQDSKISALLGECGVETLQCSRPAKAANKRKPIPLLASRVMWVLRPLWPPDADGAGVPRRGGLTRIGCPGTPGLPRHSHAHDFLGLMYRKIIYWNVIVQDATFQKDR